MKQFKHDAFYTTLTTFSGTAIEWALCHYFANGTLSYDKTIMETPLKSLFWAFFLNHCADPMIYCVHRFMHPWRNPNFPDFGKFLYRTFHSLHHKSYNTTAWSGMSMHPVEAALYYSTSILSLPFSPCPIVPLAHIIDFAINSMLGHSGFMFPGTGDFYHNIHHTNFDANYGSPNVPMDWFFGTFAKNEDAVAEIWTKVDQKSGLKGNTGSYAAIHDPTAPRIAKSASDLKAE